LVAFDEPFRRLLTQGMVVGETFFDDETGKRVYHTPDSVTVTRDGKGTFVVATHPNEVLFEGYSVAHLMEARPGIEIPAAALAALRRDEEQLDTVQQLIERMELEKDEAVWTRLDASFHLAIARASGNPVFIDVVSSIGAALSGQSEMLNAQPHRRAASQTEHRTIAAAVARGSAVEAEDAMRFHLEQVREALSVSLTEPPRKVKRARQSRDPRRTDSSSDKETP